MYWPHFLERMQNPRIRGVVHIGANDGVEYDLYAKLGVLDQIWVEPYPEPYERLLKRLPKSDRIRTYKFACGSESRKMTMTILGGGRDESNSILPPKLHLTYHPDLPAIGKFEVRVVRFDDLIKNDGVTIRGFYNLLVLDTQGYELECLKGAEETVRGMDYVLTEVNQEELYEGCALIGEIDSWLLDRGFERVYAEWSGPNKSYGDALYIRRRCL